MLKQLDHPFGNSTHPNFFFKIDEERVLMHQKSVDITFYIVVLCMNTLLCLLTQAHFFPFGAQCLFPLHISNRFSVSVPTRKRQASTDDRTDSSKKRHLDSERTPRNVSPKIRVKEKASLVGSKPSNESQAKPAAKTAKPDTALGDSGRASGVHCPKPLETENEKHQSRGKSEKDHHAKDVCKESKERFKEKDKGQSLIESDKEASKEKDKGTVKTKQKETKPASKDSDSKSFENMKELKKKDEQKSPVVKVKETTEKVKGSKKAENGLGEKEGSAKKEATVKASLKKGSGKKITEKKDLGKKEKVVKLATSNKDQGSSVKEKARPVLVRKKQVVGLKKGQIEKSEVKEREVYSSREASNNKHGDKGVFGGKGSNRVSEKHHKEDSDERKNRSGNKKDVPERSKRSKVNSESPKGRKPAEASKMEQMEQMDQQKENEVC